MLARRWFGAGARRFRALFSTLVAAILPLLFAATPALAQCGVSISGRFGGETTAVAQVGTTGLLVASGTNLEMLSLANPNAPVTFSPPRRIGLAAPARKISVAPDGLSAAVWLEDDTVVRVTILYAPLLNISNPVSTRAIEDITDILADGPRVYVSTLEILSPPRPNGQNIDSDIQIYDFSASGDPVFVGSIEPLLFNYGFDRMIKTGNLLWTGIHEGNSSMLGVEGWNVTNPAAPIRVTTSLNFAPLGSSTSISAMTAIGTLLVLSYDNYAPGATQREDWMRAVDVISPTSPVWHPPVDLNGRAGCMSSNGNVLRISISDSGVGSWSTANPAALSYLGGYFDTFPQIGQMVSGAAFGLTDYWAAGRAGLMTMNTSNPSAVSPRTTLNRLPVAPTVVRQSGNITAVLDSTFNILRLYDYTLPESQQLRSSLSLPSTAVLMEPGFLSGGVNILAIASGFGGGVPDRITLINITNPLAPVTLPNTLTGFNVHQMSLANSRLYVMTTSAEFKVIELSSLTPVLRSTTPFGGTLNDYTCMTSWEAGASKAVALGTRSFGLWLIDVTSATAPFVASVYNPVSGYRVDAVAKGDQQLYVGSTIGVPGNVLDFTLESISVTTLTAPVRRFLSSQNSGFGTATNFGNTSFLPEAFDSLTYIAAPAGKFLVGTTESKQLRGFFGTDFRSQRAVIFQISSFFALENFLAPIASQTLNGVTGRFAPSANGSRIIGAAGRAGLYQVAMPVTWAPGYVQQAFDQASCYAGTAFINTLAVANPSNVTFQWYRVGNGGSTPITDGPTGWGSTITGATQAGLTISNLRPNDRRYLYFCRTTNSCGSRDSFWADIDFCLADFNCDGAVDPDDLADYIGTYFADLPGARSDFNADGLTDPDDLADFIGAFFGGCT